MSQDIVEWLRHIANFNTPHDPRKGCRKAADEIERLRKEIAARCKSTREAT